MTLRGNVEAARSRRRRQWIGCLVLAGALSACQIHPPAPLLSPIQATGEYGYADLALGDNRYQVSYTGPSQRSLRAPDVRQQIAEAERTQAFDFALWRAAQIALPQGFVGFRVSNVRTNVDSTDDDYYDPFYAPGFYPGRPFGGALGPYWGPYGGPSPYLYTQTQVIIDVALLQSLGPGDYDARETIDRLSKAYPGATGAAAPAPG